MQFHVPQFIDVEDKIFGPLSFKQFIYLAGGAGLCVVIYVFVPYTFIAYPLMLLAAAFSGALAFYEINGKPFIFTVQAAFEYITSSRLYLWKQREHKDRDEKSPEQIQQETESIKRVIAGMTAEPGSGRIQEKAFSIDTKGDSVPAPDPNYQSTNRSAS